MRNQLKVMLIVTTTALGLLLPMSAMAQLVELANDTNQWLEAQGHNYRLDRAELLTDSGEVGTTVFFNNRTKQLSTHFIPGDPRRGGSTAIFWQSDLTDGTATSLDLARSQSSIANAMATWQDVTCSTIPLVQVSDFGIDLGLVEFIFTGGAAGSPFVFSDLVHAGFGSIDFALGQSTLAVTFTFVFIDGAGNATDVDGDGKADTALREIYYNNNFSWADDGVTNIDLQTVSTHEVGHGLSQGHFGALFLTDANGRFHFSPRAVMNAGYTGPLRALTGTDIGGHCSLWGSWPN